MYDTTRSRLQSQQVQLSFDETPHVVIHTAQIYLVWYGAQSVTQGSLLFHEGRDSTFAKIKAMYSKIQKLCTDSPWGVVNVIHDPNIFF